MKKKRFFEILRSPNGTFLIIVYLLTIATVVTSLICVATDFSPSAVYVVYAAAAITLSYSVYTFVRIGKKMKKKISSVADRYSFTKKFIHDYGFRSFVFASVSFIVNAGYAVFEAVMGIVFRSVWYGALSGYHFALGALRFGVLRGERKAEENDEKKRLGIYRACGFALVGLSVAMIPAVTQMVLSEKNTEVSSGIMIYATAAYTFYRVILAVSNIFKAKRFNDPAVQALRNIGFVDAMTSLVPLQVALIGTFSEGEGMPFMNALTGGLACLMTAGIGIGLAVAANARIRRLKEEKQNAGRKSE